MRPQIKFPFWSTLFCVVGIAVCLWLLAQSIMATPARGQGYEGLREYDVYDRVSWRRGVSAETLRCLGWEESRHRDNAYNPAGPYHGRMQFTVALWARLAPRYGHRDSSPYDAFAAVDVTAAAIADGEGGNWPPLERC